MKNLKLILPLLALVLVPFLGGCSLSFKSKGGGGHDGGVFVSQNKGETWAQKVSRPTVEGNKNLGYLEVKQLAMDPNDPKAVYLASKDFGLYYTYNIKNGWNHVSALGKNTINAVKVDPRSKCIIYAAIENTLFRSKDCNRTFEPIYFDNNEEVRVTSIAVDNYNNGHLYLGTSRGDLIKSLDDGKSWRTIQRFDDGISQIAINPSDTRDVFVATSDNDIYRFNSNSSWRMEDLVAHKNRLDGTNWRHLNKEAFEDMNLGNGFADFAFSESGETVIIATQNAIFRSVDFGLSWSKLKLLTPEKDANINTLAINPKNSQEIYYATNSTFFKSFDAGVTWSSKQLPTSKSTSDLLVDFQQPSLIYLGIKKTK